MRLKVAVVVSNLVAVLHLTVDGCTSYAYCTYSYNYDWLWLSGSNVTSYLCNTTTDVDNQLSSTNQYVVLHLNLTVDDIIIVTRVRVTRVQLVHHGSDRQRVNAFLRHSKRCGFCPPDLPDLDDLLQEADD